MNPGRFILKRDGSGVTTLAVVGLRVLPTTQVVTEDGPHPSAKLATIAGKLRAMSWSPAMPSTCPRLGRAGAANDR
jgi:hypothetical protein